VQEIRKRREQHGFVFGDHYFPHDVNNGEISSGKSRFDTLVGLGIQPVAVPRMQNVNDGINAVRRMLGQSLIDPIRCERGVKTLRNYRKEWDEDRATFRDKPLHDWPRTARIRCGTLRKAMLIRRSSGREGAIRASRVAADHGSRSERELRRRTRFRCRRAATIPELR
jgi:hypothetical protein